MDRKCIDIQKNILISVKCVLKSEFICHYIPIYYPPSIVGGGFLFYFKQDLNIK